MSLLEERYRFVLRLLPASYRATREEEMVDAFLEGAGGPDQDDARPRWSEVASVAALAVRVRLGGPGATPRHVAWGEAVRQVAVLGLFFHAMLGTLAFADALRGSQALGPTFAGPSPRDLLLSAGGLLWLAAFVLTSRGRLAAAKVLAVAAVAATPLPILDAAFHVPLYAAPLAALLAGFHRDAPAPRRPWLFAVSPALAGFALYLASTTGPPVVAWIAAWADPAGLATLALLLACAAVLTRRLRLSPLALAASALLVLLSRVAPLTHHPSGDDPFSATLTAVHLGQSIALTLCALTFAIAGARALPRRQEPARS